MKTPSPRPRQFVNRRGLSATSRLTALVVLALSAPYALASYPTAGAAEVDEPPDCVEPASTTWPITRMSGTDRYATAACASRATFTSRQTVVLARGDQAGGFADALAGTVLAHHVDGPVLLTAPDELPESTAAELARLGASEVLVLGGESAITEDVISQVRAITGHAERIAGEDRAGTAAQIASQVPGAHAFLVNSHAPADALTAGAAAARDGAALLLSGTDELPTSTLDALSTRTSVTIVGGVGVISEVVADELRALGLAVRRLGGDTRYETAATIARAHPGAERLHLVGGANRNLVDAIAAGWLAATDVGGPVVYVRADRVDRRTDRYLRLGGLWPQRPSVIVGGLASVGTPAVEQVEADYTEAGSGGPAAQMRAMWVHLFDSSLKTRAGIEQVLNAAAAANLNTIIVQAARRHDAFYDSDVLPATTDEDLTAGLDVLGELLPAAHARGLQVHVWYSLMPSIHSTMTDETLPPNHIHVQHGPGSAEPWTVPAASNTANYDFLDPGIPGVQAHVIATLREVVERYDVDGIHLDYLRYEVVRPNIGEPVSEQHPVTLQRHADHGAGQALDDFLRAQTQDLTRRIMIEIADIDPSVVVSAALIAQGDGPSGPDLDAAFTESRAYYMKGQDWPSWLDEGLIDHAFPMAYFRENDPRWAQAYDDWVTFAEHVDTAEFVTAIGQASFLNCPASSLRQFDRATQRVDGVGLYSYQGDVVEPSSSSAAGCPGAGWGDLRAALVADDAAFTTPAPLPVIGRRANPTSGHVLIETTDGTSVTLTVAGSDPIVRRADATGHAGFVWVEPGAHTVDVGGSEYVVEVVAGQVTRVAAT